MSYEKRCLKRILPVLIAISLLQSLSGCASDPIIQTRVEVQRIPESLTVPCPVSQLGSQTYQGAIELALSLKQDLVECNRRMEEIRAFSGR